MPNIHHTLLGALSIRKELTINKYSLAFIQIADTLNEAYKEIKYEKENFKIKIKNILGKTEYKIININEIYGLNLKEQRISPVLLQGLCGSKNKNESYYKLEIPKKNGNIRILYIPGNPLKLVQRLIYKSLHVRFHPHKSAKGFVEKGSIIKHASKHINKKYVYILDLENFFVNIGYNRIFGLLKAFPFNFSENEAWVIANLCTYENQLPQGAPTSPYLSNMICRKMDSRLSNFAIKHEIAYSRYADDLCFSSDNEITDSIKNFIKEIINEEGFKTNPKKERLIPYYKRQIITGLIVNKKLALPREWLKNFKALLYNLNTKEIKGEINRKYVINMYNLERYKKGELSEIELGAFVHSKNKYNLLISPKHSIKFLIKEKANRNKKLIRLLGGKMNFIKMVYGGDSKTYISLEKVFEKIKDKLENISEEEKRIIASINIITSFEDIKDHNKKFNKIDDLMNKNPDAEYVSEIHDKFIECKLDNIKNVVNDWGGYSVKYRRAYCSNPKITGLFYSQFSDDNTLKSIVHSNNDGNITQEDIINKIDKNVNFYKSYNLITFEIHTLFNNYLNDYINKFKSTQSHPCKDSDFSTNKMLPFRKKIRFDNDNECTNLIHELKKLTDKSNLRRESPLKITIDPEYSPIIYTDTENILNGIEEILESMISNSHGSEIKITILTLVDKKINIIIEDNIGSIERVANLELLIIRSHKLQHAIRILRGLVDWTLNATFEDGRHYQINVMENIVTQINSPINNVKHTLTIYQ